MANRKGSATLRGQQSPRSGLVLWKWNAVFAQQFFKLQGTLATLFYPHESVAQAVTLPLKGQQVTMMCQAVNHSHSHLVIGKDGAPIGKLQIGGNDETPVLVAA